MHLMILPVNSTKQICASTVHKQGDQSCSAHQTKLHYVRAGVSRDAHREERYPLDGGLGAGVPFSHLERATGIGYRAQAADPRSSEGGHRSGASLSAININKVQSADTQRHTDRRQPQPSSVSIYYDVLLNAAAVGQ